ncbi:MAG: archease [Dehalococcoidales bacterium]|nr:MAG: archease [Dehalococcoidales bacterium]
MVNDFELLEHTADVGIIAYGASIDMVFANAGKALFSLITELEDIEEVRYRNIEVEAQDRESLLVRWLNELIYIFDTENILFKVFDIKQLTDTNLKAVAGGEAVDTTRHRLKTGVKAATYHMLKIDKDDGYRAQVLLDI